MQRIVFGILNSIFMIMLVASAVALALILFTYSASDPGFNNSNSPSEIANIGGNTGAHIADLALYFFGYFAYLLPVSIALFGWNYQVKWKGQSDDSGFLPIIGFFIGLILALMGGCGLESLYGSYQTKFHHGGVLGYEVTKLAALYLPDSQNASLTFVVLFLLGSTALGLIPCFKIFELTGQSITQSFKQLFSTVRTRKDSEFDEHDVVEEKPKTRLKKIKDSTVPKEASIKKPKKRKFFTKKKFRKRKSQPEKSKTKKNIVARPERVEPMIVPLTAGPKDDNANYTEREENNQDSTFEGEELYDDESEYYAEVEHQTSYEFEESEENENQSFDSEFPDPSILDPSNKLSHGYSDSEIQEIAQKITKSLGSFKKSVTVRGASIGPVITQFQVEPGEGVKTSEITGLSADLARTLAVQSVRVEENIPNSTYIGLEVPNRSREIVRLVDLLESPEYRESNEPLTIALGKNIRGKTVVTQLQSMPHLLVAGTTGSGKSVCLNTILLSFLFKMPPRDLRLIMIDPKMLEFSVYEGIPHLLAPVITDMKKTEIALLWCIDEMERRFNLMTHFGVRSMSTLNQVIDNSDDPVYDPNTLDNIFTEPQELQKLPYIVLIIDELADLIMVLGKKAEELIIRIAQRARAAGIHLIVATQRPSTDVIRGVLKANIPTRIAFKVASLADSRTILDLRGAESLLGAGDMLFIAPGSAVAKRVHGAFVSDEEVLRVVDSIRRSSEPKYDESLQHALTAQESSTASLHGGVQHPEVDSLYNEAVDYVIRSRRPTISSVQRQLRIGYNRAARIIDTMENEGIISPAQKGGKREVLVPAPDEQ